MPDLYGEEVYQSVAAYNSEQYPDISTLMRMTFSDALSYFEDGSIDLLHIDGQHHFDDVKGDFETWLPKLSTRAVVLLHDTNIRDRQFGVHRFFAEQTARYSHFNFVHGCGLGVLGIGKDLPKPVANLFNASANETLVASIRGAYARLGGAVAHAFRANEEYRNRIEHERQLQEQKRASESSIAERDAARSAAQERAQEAARLASELEGARAAGREREQDAARLARELDAARQFLLDGQTEVQRLAGEIDAARQEGQRSIHELSAAREELTTREQRVGMLAGEVEAARAEAARLASELEGARAAGREREQDAARLARELDAARQFLRDGQTEVQRLAGEIDAARQEGQRSIHELSAAREELTTREQRVGMLAGEVEAARAEAARLASELEGARAAGREREQDAARLARELDAARQFLRDSQTEVQRLAGEIDAARQEGQRSIHELSAAREELTTREQRVGMLAGEVEAARAEAARLASELEGARAAGREREQDAARLARELDAARQFLRDSQTEVQRLAGEIDAARQEGQRSIHELSAAREELTTREQRVGMLAGEVEAARAEAARLASELEGARAAGREREQDAARLARELDAARQFLRDSQTEVQRLAGEIDEARREDQRRGDQLAAARGEIDLRKRRIGELSSELQAAKDEADRLIANRDEARRQIVSMTFELDVAREELSRRGERIEELSKLREQVIGDLSGELQAAKAEAAKLIAERDEARRQAVANTLERDAALQFLGDSRTEVQRLTGELDAARQFLRDSQTEVQRFAGEIDEARRADQRKGDELTVARGEIALRGRRISELSSELQAAGTKFAEADAERARTTAALEDTRRHASEREFKSAAQAASLARDLEVTRALLKDLQATVEDQARRLDSAPLRNGKVGVFRRLTQRLRRANVRNKTHQWEYDVIRKSKLFDALWYLRRYRDVAAAGDDPLRHYIRFGAGENRDPQPLFDTKWYRTQAPDLTELTISPLAHYVSAGVARGLDPHPLFDTDWYLAQNPDVAAAHVNPLYHFKKMGGPKGLDPHPLFDTSWYLQQNLDVMASGDNALHHYVTHGWKEVRDPHPEFSTSCYLEENPDVASANICPLQHYVEFGRIEGRRRRPSMRKNDSEHLIVGPAAERTSSLPAPLTRLLSMFHSDSTNAMLERCYDLVARFDGFEITEESFFKTSALVELLNDLKRMSAHANKSAQYKVSIIIPVHNKLIYTLCCVYSILAVTRRANFEIIVADDVSTDATASVLSAIGGAVKLICQQQNLGFLRNCNAAVAQARGQVIVLLNDDTFVLPNWLEELVDALEGDETIGLAGPKLVNANGTLQEAGAIVWNDASAWNFGRGGDACAPQYNYAKEVDYISGASIALRKTVWNKLGGFDEIYAPAYCEDVDLAFRVRQAGLRVVYRPHSAVIHHEGVSHGRDISSGIKSYQERNKHILFDRWKDVLTSQHYENGANIQVARDRSACKPRILIIDHYVPQPDRDAGSRSMMHYIELFARHGFQVTFWPHNRRFDRPYVMLLQRLGIETVYGWNDIWPEFGRWIVDNGNTLNYAFVSRPSVAIDFLDQIKTSSKAKILFYGHDIHFRRLQFEYAVTKNEKYLIESKEAEALERLVWSKSDVIYYPSAEEQQFLETQIPGSTVRNLPLYVYDKKLLQASEERLRVAGIPQTHRLLFIGGFRHRPNVDAVLWFCSTIWPNVLNKVADAHLVIAGSSPPENVRALSGNHITVTGAISDHELKEIYLKTNVAIVPLRYGAGMKGKVLEALSFGVPVVTTDVGVQGLAGLSNIVRIADDPKKFAAHILDVMLNPNAEVERVKAGLECVAKEFSTSSALATLSKDIPEMNPVVDGMEEAHTGVAQ